MKSLKWRWETFRGMYNHGKHRRPWTYAVQCFYATFFFEVYTWEMKNKRKKLRQLEDE